VKNEFFSTEGVLRLLETLNPLAVSDPETLPSLQLGGVKQHKQTGWAVEGKGFKSRKRRDERRKKFENEEVKIRLNI
jgi:hypothetical protein